MEKYDYIKAVKADILAYLADNNIELTEENFEDLHNDMWASDQVTGNASGSYTFNTRQAEENLCHNWDMVDMVCRGLDIEPDFDKGAEYWDVAIRCYLLGACMREILEEREGA